MVQPQPRLQKKAVVVSVFLDYIYDQSMNKNGTPHQDKINTTPITIHAAPTACLSETTSSKNKKPAVKIVSTLNPLHRAFTEPIVVEPYDFNSI